MKLQSLFQELIKRGYFIGHCPPRELLDFIAPLGKIVVDPRNPTPIRDIRPQTVSSSNPNTLSSRFGLGGFPFHTDAAHWKIPPRYLVLYCVHPGRGGRPTLIQDSSIWMEDKKLKHAALREVWKSGHQSPQLCTAGIMINERFAVRFDEACMEPMTRTASELRTRIRTLIQSSPVFDVIWTPETVLILDNQRMLHARGMASKHDFDRVLKRILVGAPT